MDARAASPSVGTLVAAPRRIDRAFRNCETRGMSTPLSELLRLATPPERERLARLAGGTTVNYLYQLAGCHRPRPSAEFAVQLADATVLLNRETKGRLPIITVRELATMCALAGIDGRR